MIHAQKGSLAPIVKMTGKISFHKSVMIEIERAVKKVCPDVVMATIVDNHSALHKNAILIEIEGGRPLVNDLIEEIYRLATETDLWLNVWGRDHFRTLQAIYIDCKTPVEENRISILRSPIEEEENGNS